VALEPDTPEDNRLTADGIIGGTPAYIAPEMVDGQELDGRADIYALGCVAYWLLTGHAPFERRTPLATVMAHVSETPTPPSELAEEEIPPALEQVVMACLEKDPAARPATAEELARRLEEAVPSASWTQPRARKWWEVHRPQVPAQESPISGDATLQIGKLEQR
jgi:serine/threonine protein kinase